MLRKILSTALIAVSLAWMSAPVNSVSGSTTVVVTGNNTVAPVLSTSTVAVSPSNTFTITNSGANYLFVVFSAGQLTKASTGCDAAPAAVTESAIASSGSCTLTVVSEQPVTLYYSGSATAPQSTLTIDSSANGSTPSSPSGPVSLWRAELDPNGGVCTEGGVRRDAEWTKMFVGYGYVPGASDCTRPGFTLSGWANAATPTTVSAFPSLIDPSDGKRRFFVAENVDLVAVWEPVANPPATPSVFVGSLGLFCTDCGVFLLWNVPSDGSTVSVSGPDGSEVCVGTTFTLGGWSLCVVPTGVAGTYSLTTQRDGATSLPITTAVA